MSAKWWLLPMVFLLLPACAPAASTAQPAPTPTPSAAPPAATATPAATPEDTGWEWSEYLRYEGEHTAALRDGSPIPQGTLPLYYRGNWKDCTWAELAEETGFAAEDLRALNPQVREGEDGRLQGNVFDLLLAEEYLIPQTAEAEVTVTVPSMPEAYRECSYQVPASLPQEAAAALALAYYNLEAEGQGFVTEPSEVDGYNRVTSGVRFTTFSRAEEYFSTFYAPDVLASLLEPVPWQSEKPAAYYAQGEGDALLLQGYAFDHIIPQSGYTHTEPEQQADGSLRFAGVCIIMTDDMGEPLPQDACRLYYAPTVLVETPDGWRVQQADSLF
ncbi:MAG: hypothetical protein DBX91_07515 [Subdoligranulum variabile]|nr:MAG: hypothetical protein DBX91_07515 [Subdoligranulum variabile]